MRTIDKTPNPLTGDANRDFKILYDYLIYLRDQLNTILAQIGKE